MKHLLPVAALCGLLATSAQAEESVELEIDHLLNTVAASGCIFIRNGKEHAAEDARDHLAMKRKRGKRYYSSTEEFIERLASSSSWSGKPYHIRCGDSERPAQDWFTAVLEEYRATSTQLPIRQISP